jgi:hypothetical protein
MSTLLEKARTYSGKKHHAQARYTSEEIELAVAWANDELRYVQIANVLNTPPTSGNTYRWVALRLREAVRRGRLVDAEFKKVGEP